MPPNDYLSVGRRDYLSLGLSQVIEYPSSEQFPTAGESGKLYVDLASEKLYRWTGTTYVEVSPGGAVTAAAILAAAQAMTDAEPASFRAAVGAESVGAAETVRLGAAPVLGLVSETDATPVAQDNAAGGGTNYTWRKKHYIHPCKNPILLYTNTGRITAVAPATGRTEGLDSNIAAINVKASLERADGTIFLAPDPWTGAVSCARGNTFLGPIPIAIPALEACWIRSYVDVNASANYRGSFQALWGYAGAGDPPYTSGEGRGTGDCTLTGTCWPYYGAGGNCAAVAAVLGEVTRKTGVLILGDSTAAGAGAVWDGFGAWHQVAFHGRLPYISYGCGQDLVTNIALPIASHYRMTMAKYCGSAIICAGVNDAGTKTSAQILAAYGAIAARLKTLGVERVYVTTICPTTTSTDGWLTLANQTVNGAKNTVIQAVNASLRAAPPTNVDAVIDFSALAEEGMTGKWKAQTILYGPAVPTDKPIAHAFRFTGAGWAVNQHKGKALYSITGNKYTTVITNTEDTLYTIPNTIAATDNCRIVSGFTGDGTHGTQVAADAYGAAVRAAYGI